MATRTTPLSIQAYGASLRILAAAAPGRADRLLARRFLTPRRRRTLPPDIPGVPAERELVRHERESLAVWHWGAGPDVLLAHGWESSAATWAALVPRLVAAGYRVTAFDMPAHGISTGRRTSVLGMAAAIRTVADTLGPLAAVIGHSAGATAAALAAGDGLKAGRCVLLAPR
ncbi:MAG: alpha/beta fold hydrolase, partial [Gemmatimonadetes bacterium]|nr:alpha/beta hydrolase [Gemmatimonadota bacterium]NIQ54911.1 alpha/beta hydrolase [Gemmatimonadota bacterium]NIU75108.1 alpha/beta fold hydrolase [Gammaproteobacteria bacterium]NIX44939.1 alpha/beta fold hydrolase [Gemmatimonadota bacterium]NIY09172.1 alpha/beta fold hydrolase [Gemmatimonadota bacterium]